MLNKEKYKNDLENILARTVAVSKSGEIYRCVDRVNCDSCDDCIFCNDDCIEVAKVWLNSEYKEQILDKVERKYLSSVIGPFRDKVLYIQKVSIGTDNIRIGIKNDNTINLPCFKKDTMYKNMKAWKKYTLEDLGI